MDEKKETSLVVKNDSFFDRLKAFFKMFFEYLSGSEKENQNKEDNTNNEDNTRKNVVEENLKHIEKMDESDFSYEEYENKLQEILLALQQAYETGIIKEEELTNEQKADLKNLYVLQINYLKDSIEKNEAVILKLKEKIDIINDNK